MNWDYAHIIEWFAYFQIEPSANERIDTNTAVIASVIANVNRSSKQKPYKTSDFLSKL